MGHQWRGGIQHTTNGLWEFTVMIITGHLRCIGDGSGENLTTRLYWGGMRRKWTLFPSCKSQFALVTLMAHFTASAVSSDTTMSTHFRLGARSLRICFLTIASKARSGVKRPVLKGGRGSKSDRVEAEEEKTDIEERGGGKQREKESSLLS